MRFGLAPVKGKPKDHRETRYRRTFGENTYGLLSDSESSGSESDGYVVEDDSDSDYDNKRNNFCYASESEVPRKPKYVPRLVCGPNAHIAKVIESSPSHNKGRTRTQQRYCIYKITCQLSGPARGMAATGQDRSICELVIPKTRPTRGWRCNRTLMLRVYYCSEGRAVGDFWPPQTTHTCMQQSG